MINLIDNENIKTVDDFSQHLELEVESLNRLKPPIKTTRSRNAYVAHKDSCASRKPKCKNYVPR